MARKLGAGLVGGLPNQTVKVMVNGNVINVFGEYPITVEDFSDVEPNDLYNLRANFLNPSNPGPVRIQVPDVGRHMQAVFLRDQLRKIDLTPQDRPNMSAPLADAWLVEYPFEGPGFMPGPGNTAELNDMGAGLPNS